MATKALPSGVWPTMITPFKEGVVDWPVLAALIEWYIAAGCSGLFAVCQSSEMYALTEPERLELATFVSAKVAGRAAVVACGNSDQGSVEEQAAAINKIAPIVDAVVVLTCMLAKQEESEEVWKENATKLMALTECSLGLYEVPIPYKRLMSPELLKWCAATGRFIFHKDTCCDKEQIKAKIEAVASLEGETAFRFYNANIETLQYSNDCGGAGFSGISANFYPWMHVAMCDPKTAPEHKALLQSFVSIGEQVIVDNYPCSAKKYLALAYGEGLPIDTVCKVADFPPFNDVQVMHLQDLKKMMEHVCSVVGIAPQIAKVE